MIDLLNPKRILEWAGLLALLSNVVVLLLSTRFVSKSEFGTVTEAINKLSASFDTREDAIEARVAKLEGMTENLPTKDALHEVKLQISDQSGEIKALRESNLGVRASLARIESHLLDGKSR